MSKQQIMKTSAMEGVPLCIYSNQTGSMQVHAIEAAVRPSDQKLYSESYVKHIEGERDWFKKRMTEYRDFIYHILDKCNSEEWDQGIAGLLIQQELEKTF